MRAPIGYSHGAWRRFVADIGALADRARTDPRVLKAELVELADRARWGDELFEVVALARKPLVLGDDLTASGEIEYPPARRPWETDAEHVRRVEEHRGHRPRRRKPWEPIDDEVDALAAEMRNDLADEAIAAALRDGDRVVVSVMASGERRVRKISPAEAERRRSDRQKKTALIAAAAVKPCREPRGRLIVKPRSGQVLTAGGARVLGLGVNARGELIDLRSSRGAVVRIGGGRRAKSRSVIPITSDPAA